MTTGSRSIRCLAVALVLVTGSMTAMAKDVTDTLYSRAGDRIILEYSVAQAGGKTTLTFNNVQKKLGTENQKKYKKLDEVKVVIFDRTGTYGETKFDGMTPNAFMVPAGADYKYSQDGFFILQDNPKLEFSGCDDIKLDIPLFLAHYEKKHRYKVFSQCDPLSIKASGGKGGSTATGSRDSGGTRREEVISSEELLDEGLSPAEEALIRISTMRNMLDMATKIPFEEELKHEYAVLSDLRMKITDASVGRQVDEALRAYTAKRQELEAKSEADEERKKEEARQEAAAIQARQDSIQAAQEKKADEKQKNMMWLIGGIAVISLLFMGSKQVMQMVKNNKMQKKMEESMRKAQEAQQQMLGGANSPLGQMAAQGQREARRTLTKEGEAAKKRLEALRKGNTQQTGSATGTAPAAPQPKKPSLNDAIPARYKRWRKPGSSDSNNNVTI